MPQSNKAPGKVLLVSILIALSTYALRVISRSTTYQTFDSLLSRVDTEQKLVALTFDDGPMREKTEAVLNILAEFNVPATFFLVGEAIAADPVQAKLVASAGHEIGNHSYTHRRMVFTRPGVVAREIEKTNSLIRASGYRGEIHFRPP